MLRRMRAAVLAAGLAVLAACGGGGGGDDGGDAANQAPLAVALASGDVQLDGNEIQVSLGGAVQLDASGSTDADQDTLTFRWTVVSRPVGSASAPRIDGRSFGWQPDVLGSYVVQLTVTDGRGGSATQQIRFVVNNRRPVANVVSTVLFSAEPVVVATQAITVGGSVVLDGSTSVDPDGAALAVSHAWVSRPTGSAAGLNVSGKVATFTADLAGEYVVRVQGTNDRGVTFVAQHAFRAENRAPNPVVVATPRPVALDNGSQVVNASVGYDVALVATSTDPDGDVLSASWTLATRPAGSAAALTGVTSGTAGLVPDVLGDYVVRLTSTDAKGASATYTTTVRVNNRRPVAGIATNATPQALPAAPSLLLPVGTELTLRGTPSVDADGDALTYAWVVATRPAGSTAALSSATATNPTFSPDREGAYVLRLRVTDPTGAWSERSLTVNVGTHPPVAVVDQGQATLLVGGTLTASAALSFDDDGDALTYQWALDAKPADSALVLGAANQPVIDVTPDVVGTYVLSVSVSDGRSTSVAYVSVRALAQVAASYPLGFSPGEVRYSTGLDKLVALSSFPHALRIVDPFTGSIRSVVLPIGGKRLSLSGDGRLAVVLHESLFSLIDLQTATLLRTTATDAPHSDAFVNDAGIVHLIGHGGSQWNDQPVSSFDGRTGVRIPQSIPYANGTFYGGPLGIYAHRIHRLFLVSSGLSPSKITHVRFNPSTHLATQAGDWPYHGTYSAFTPLYLSGGSQDLVFTPSGTYFRTDTLAYAGQLGGITGMSSFSHSAQAEEALVLTMTGGTYYGPTDYPTAYRRFTGSLLLPAADLPFPMIGGVQSHGMKVFHSAADRHVLLVQTGTATPQGAGAQYHVVVR